MAQVRDMLHWTFRFGLSSSQLEVTCSLKSCKLALADDLFHEANLATQSNDRRTARASTAAALEIIDDRKNSRPPRFR